jgi:hypothetical protein
MEELRLCGCGFFCVCGLIDFFAVVESESCEIIIGDPFALLIERG